METRFFLPVVVAAALHATAFVGFRTPARHLVAMPPANAEPARDAIRMLPIEDPIVDVSPDAGVAKGAPDTTPRSVEVVEFDARDRIGQVAVPISPHEIVPALMISFEPIGRPEGISVTGMGPVNMSALDNPPRTRSQVAPVYPNDVKVEGKGGEVLIEFVVDESGRVLDARVVKSTDRRFETATLRAVAKWKFEPGKVNGRPVRFRMVAPVVFSLET